jgi:hypothetical protein
MYHQTLPARIVRNHTEEVALGPGWVDTPAKLAVPKPPTEEAEEVIEPQGSAVEMPAKRGPGRPKKAVA